MFTGEKKKNENTGDKYKLAAAIALIFTKEKKVNGG
jgi:hypothetical protein